MGVGVAGLYRRLKWSRRAWRSCLSCCTRRQCGVAVMVDIFDGGGVGSMAGADHRSVEVEVDWLSGMGVLRAKAGCAVTVVVVEGVVGLVSSVVVLMLLSLLPNFSW